MKKLDNLLGIVVMRFWAVLALIASVASIGFGIIVIPTAIFPGILLIFLGIGFIWLGIRAWRDRSTFGEILNRDFHSDKN
jgi:cell division protein FtsX